MGDSGNALSFQALDAKGNVVNTVFFPADSRHVAITSAIGTVCTQITDLSGTVGAVRFAEITATVACHYKPAAAKALVSGAAFAAGDNPFLPANVPKIISMRDCSFIGARGAVGGTAGTLHITLLL